MFRVLLIHADKIPHYRIPIYNYLSAYLKHDGFELFVLSDGIQPGNPHSVDFQFLEMRLSFWSIARVISRQKFDVIIDYMELRHRYLFPTYFFAKGVLGRKMIYWGQGCDLAATDAQIKNLAYAIEQGMSDAIILYADHLRKYVPKRFHGKVFIANNTLCLNYPGLPADAREKVLAEHGIRTRKNIVCVGRIQKRKRLECLVQAVSSMKRPDVGLVLVGPDPDGILGQFKTDNVYKLGALYGDRKFDLLSAMDVYCLPGAVGLSIVDAFQCGLPFVTEAGDESAEIMYLKDGVNGFVVPRGDIGEMASKLQLLLDNAALRKQFSDAAKKEIEENGHIDKLCTGFRDALHYVTRQRE